MATFVLVPGGGNGGWYYRDLAENIRRHGDPAYPVTLTGIGERHHLLTATTNLETHIQDVVGLLEYEQIDDAVLCAHSYGGMVISGVADRVPERVSRLVYVDAFVPADGESCWDLTPQGTREAFLQRMRGNGYALEPPEGADPRMTPHPVASLLQEIRLRGDVHKIRPREFVYLNGWKGTPFTPLYQQLRQDPTWTVHTLPVGHDVMAEAPDKLLEILLAQPGPRRE